MATNDVVAFEIGGERYAMDIHLSREIVEMMPITPIPRAPEYIAGIINLRGEITTILNITNLLGIRRDSNEKGKNIIVLVPEAANGSNLGVIVDDVQSVLQVDNSDVQQMDTGMANVNEFIKGIIKLKKDDIDKKQKDSGTEKDLMIWIDVQKIIEKLVNLDAIGGK